MLTRQLASAGSGKTYSLAKQFIWLYLTIPCSEDSTLDRCNSTGEPKRRLRTRSELRDSLRHILAVTFTNKATGEMKDRIINKLAALASYNQDSALTDEERIEVISRIDYLQDFSDALNVEPSQIANTSREALDVLLNDFSDFQVSTIDSFFQLVMRTFTYEADLPDNFQIELDANYVAGLGLDSALTDLNSSRASEALRFWTRKTVEVEMRNSGSWNIFAPGKRTLYSRILGMIKTMESESFKERLQALRDYFDSIEGEGDPKTGGKMGEIYSWYDNKYILPLRHSASVVREAARETLDYINRNDIDPKDLAQWLYGRLKGLATLNWRQGPSGNFTHEAFLKETAMKKGLECDPDFLSRVHATGYALEKYIGNFSNPKTRSWLTYSDSIRHLALTWEIKKKIDEMMVDSNTIQLSDTNSILRTIIGDDETPFIYERIGARLDHFLIDEFQDTSRLQWEITLPLLRESESRGKENLIIGDPKQSIYRFRNADSSLITSAVKKAFPSLYDAGSNPKTNTNWRSSLNIVRFNNHFFHSLASMGMDYTSSYGDVIQFSNKFNPGNPEKTDAKGLVRIRLYRKGDSNPENSDSEGDETLDFPEYYRDLGYIITDLRRRGFRQKDIAILVATHNSGEEVINAILDFNSHIDPEADEVPETIRFVSEDSLKVNNAHGVRTVIEAMKAINGTAPFTRPPVTEFSEGQQSDFAIDEALSTDQTVDPFDVYRQYADRSQPLVSDALREMLEGMSVVSLPAIVEQIIRTFVPQAVRNAEAPFLAAFQDCILEFSEGHIADIPSFLKWWEKHGDSLTISSPESTDAVRIVTVHSSKGLEFGAVIIPDANYSFRTSSRKVETAWLQPKIPQDPYYPLPPVLPVELTSKLESTLHRKELEDNLKEVATDKMNMAYVAFTRAKHELHILSDVAPKKWPVSDDENGEKKKSRSKKTSIGDIQSEKVPVVDSLPQAIFSIFLKEDGLSPAPYGKSGYVIDSNELKIRRGKMPSLDGKRIQESIEIEYGQPVTLDATEEDLRDQHEIVSSYTVSDFFPALHFRREVPLLSSDDNEEDEDSNQLQPTTIVSENGEPSQEEIEEEATDEDEIDPGSERALARELLARLGRIRDLSKAMKPLEISGRWSEKQINKIYEMVREFMTLPEAHDLIFPNTDWKVYVNRPLIHRHRKTRTPDRILISKRMDKAIIVNFKTEAAVCEGDRLQMRAHLRAFRKTGFTGTVEGRLCHLPTAQIWQIF